ncbi:MAG: choline-phosphate cytidylyltransferase, partial [archaeon]|nr:choline-phosphate cytidylyltransferase [archaeon]
MESKELPKEGTDPKNPVHIYTDGIYDLYHFGHAKVFEQCKKMFPYVYLVVGVCTDEDTAREKGATPIMTYEERAENIRHCKWVDEVVKGPWLCSLKFLESVGCKYIAHDPEPYKYGDIEDVYGPFKEAGRFLATKRTEGISTTDLIGRIIKNYDSYVERSVKKGCKWNELNISTRKFFGIRIKLMIAGLQRKKKDNFLRLS